jgi:hypothetical protein
MSNVAQIRALTTVLIGDFNPTIFQPAWFAAEGLLTEEEVKTASVNIVHPDVTSFELQWVRFTIERERFVAMSLAQPYFDRLVGTVCTAFDLLRHTPIRLFGINNEAHYRASSIEKWHALGHKLAPKEFWQPYFKTPGMQNVTIRQNPRPDGLGGHVQIAIEPSERVKPGIFISVNDQFQEHDGKPLGAVRTVELLREKWTGTSEFSEIVFQDLSQQVV